jgi:hypothetical protein
MVVCLNMTHVRSVITTETFSHTTYPAPALWGQIDFCGSRKTIELSLRQTVYSATVLD